MENWTLIELLFSYTLQTSKESHSSDTDNTCNTSLKSQQNYKHNAYILSHMNHKILFLLTVKIEPQMPDRINNVFWSLYVDTFEHHQCSCWHLFAFVYFALPWFISNHIRKLFLLSSQQFFPLIPHYFSLLSFILFPYIISFILFIVQWLACMSEMSFVNTHL